MPLPLILAAGLGIAAGAGLGAAVGPEEEPLWKRMLIGGALGGTAGLGLGAAAAPAGATALTGTAGTVANPAVTGSLVGGGVGATPTAATGLVANPAFAGATAAPAVTAPVTFNPMNPAAFNSFGGGNFAASNQALMGPGQFIAEHPIGTGIAGLGGMMMLSGDNAPGDGRDGSSEWEGKPAAWEGASGKPSGRFSNSVDLYEEDEDRYNPIGRLGRALPRRFARPFA